MYVVPFRPPTLSSIGRSFGVMVVRQVSSRLEPASRIFQAARGIPLLKPRSPLRRYPWNMWYSCKAAGALALRLAPEMSSSDGTSATNDAARRRRRRSNSLLLVLAVGFLVFGAAVGTLYYALRPVTLRIAVGPPGSDDHKVIEAMAEAFASESRTVRLSPITADGAVEALALLGAGKVDLAVGRADLEMPADAQTIAIVRKNFVVLWAPSGLAGKSSKRRPAAKIKEIADLAGHKVGIIGRTPANAAFLRVILSAAGVEADKVAVTHFGT